MHFLYSIYTKKISLLARLNPVSGRMLKGFVQKHFNGNCAAIIIYLEIGIYFYSIGMANVFLPIACFELCVNIKSMAINNDF